MSLFDDNVDIFADLTMSPGPKEKSKKKDTKWLFDDDMGEIFNKLLFNTCQTNQRCAFS